MDDRTFTLEIWKRHPKAANVYSEQLIQAALVEYSPGDFEWVDLFSIKTDRHKIIGSDESLIFASRQE